MYPITARSSATAEIARFGGRYPIEGHSRSLMLVPIERPRLLNIVNNIDLTYILCRNVFQLPLSIGQVIAFDKRVSIVNALVLGYLCEYSYILLTTCRGLQCGLSSTTST